MSDKNSKIYAVVRRGVKKNPQDPRCKFMDETDFHLSLQGRKTIRQVVELASGIKGFVYAEWADESRARLPDNVREMIFAYDTLIDAEMALKLIWESPQWMQCAQAGIAHGEQCQIDVWSIDWKFSIESVPRPVNPIYCRWLTNGN